MKQPIPNPVMIARIAINSMTKLWCRSLTFRICTLPFVLVGALLTAYALKTEDITT